MAAVSRFWVFWIRNTIRKVTMVVEVLITSCQVSLKWNSGPEAAQISTSATARMKVAGRPVVVERKLENRENHCVRIVASVLDRECR